MADVTFLLILLAFFGAAVGLVAACDRIIGPEPVAADPDRVVAAGATGPADERTPADAR